MAHPLKKRDLKLVQKVTQFKEFNLSKPKPNLQERSQNVNDSFAFKARPVPDFIKPALSKLIVPKKLTTFKEFRLQTDIRASSKTDSQPEMPTTVLNTSLNTSVKRRATVPLEFTFASEARIKLR